MEKQLFIWKFVYMHCSSTCKVAAPIDKSCRNEVFGKLPLGGIGDMYRGGDERERADWLREQYCKCQVSAKVRDEI